MAFNLDDLRRRRNTPFAPNDSLGQAIAKLIFKHLGRRYRLTDVSGKVVRDIIS